ncbi:hypothetical protein D3C87_1155600 [compost metagenome]
MNIPKTHLYRYNIYIMEYKMSDLSIVSAIESNKSEADAKNTELSTGAIIIQLALYAIQNDDVEELDAYVRRMSLEETTESETADLLSSFLENAARFNSKRSLMYILTTWSQLYPDSDKISFMTRLFMMMYIDITVLIWIIEVVEVTSFLDIITELCEVPNSDQLELVVRRCFSAFGVQTAYTLQVAIESAESKNAYVIADALSVVLMKDKEFQKIPEWIGEYGYTVKDIVIEDIRIDEASVLNMPFEQVLEELMQSIKVNNDLDATIDRNIVYNDDGSINFEESEVTQSEYEELIDISQRDIMNVIAARISLAPNNEKMKILAPIFAEKELAELQDDTILFRIFGPANPMYNSNPSQMSLGGCRMFTCSVFDFDSEEQVYTDWFTGSCDTCMRRIRKRSHAVRLPRATGGWLGCHCSIKCLKKQMNIRESEYNVTELPTRSMVDTLEEQLLSIGIQEGVVEDYLLTQTPNTILSGPVTTINLGNLVPNETGNASVDPNTNEFRTTFHSGSDGNPKDTSNNEETFGISREGNFDEVMNLMQSFSLPDDVTAFTANLSDLAQTDSAIKEFYVESHDNFFEKFVDSDIGLYKRGLGAVAGSGLEPDLLDLIAE